MRSEVVPATLAVGVIAALFAFVIVLWTQQAERERLAFCRVSGHEEPARCPREYCLGHHGVTDVRCTGALVR